MKKFIGCWAVLLFTCQVIFSQVDTTFIYNANTPYGTLDIRIAKSSSRYYYLQENKTFSFRESPPGVRTGTYRDMTSWDSSPYRQGNLREKNGTADYFILNYRLLLPLNYSTSYAAGYPLIIMMHGAGERGNCWDSNCFWSNSSWNPNTNIPSAPTSPTHQLLNNDYNLLHGGSQHLQARNLAGNLLPNDPNLPGRAFPGFVLFPQNLNGWNPNNAQDAIRLVRLLMKKYKIDPNRIYVHGLSNGGIATYEVIKRAPWLFTAALPMSAPSEAGIINSGQRPKVAHIPLWIFQGGKDTAPTPSRTQSYVKSFRDAGAIVRYTEYANLGHGVWNTAYAEPDFFSWMLSKNKANIHLFAGISSLCSNGQGVRMELAEGFFNYQWEYNGAILSGATTAHYTATTPGTYRARFSRKINPSASDWNRWSDPVQVTSTNNAKPTIVQNGTVVLPGLDNIAYATLHAQGTFAYYYWYKNGALLNLPGSQDDTISHAIIGAEYGNGVYTLVVASPDHCTSPPSDGKYIFFNGQAPVNISAPTDFNGSPLSDGRVSLTWNDASSNENGFEIWRRRQTGSSTFSSWQMAPITPANATSMIDKGLTAASTYQYKIRAVGNTGRSNYTPAASDQFLTVVTSGDSQNPTAPQNLTAESTDIREIQRRWNASTDNQGIKEYQIYLNSQVIGTGSPVTSYKLTNLPLNTNYTITVRAKDFSDNLSAASNSVSASTVVNGLFYEHSTGVFSDIDQINWSFVEFKGKVNNFTLAPRTQEDYFNFQFKGYLYITNAGTYQFQTTSDEGSRVTIDNAVVVDNDGRHDPRTITGPTVTLQAGGRLINVKYFEYINGQVLTVRYKGPDTGNAWVTIPDAVLRSGTGTTALNSMLAFESTTSDSLMNAEAESPVLEVYPNPSRSAENLTLRVSGIQHQVNIKLMDMMGKTYYENTVPIAGFENGFPITLKEQLTEGIYIVIIQEGNKTRKQTLIVKN